MPKKGRKLQQNQAVLRKLKVKRMHSPRVSRNLVLVKFQSTWARWKSVALDLQWVLALQRCCLKAPCRNSSVKGSLLSQTMQASIILTLSHTQRLRKKTKICFSSLPNTTSQAASLTKEFPERCVWFFVIVKIKKSPCPRQTFKPTALSMKSLKTLIPDQTQLRQFHRKGSLAVVSCEILLVARWKSRVLKVTHCSRCRMGLCSPNETNRKLFSQWSAQQGKNSLARLVSVRSCYSSRHHLPKEKTFMDFTKRMIQLLLATLWNHC